MRIIATKKIVMFVAILMMGSTLLISNNEQVNAEIAEELRGDRDFDEILMFTEGVRAAADVDYLLHEHHGGMWCDAEKTVEDTEDDEQCWAGAASNVLEWTGWGLGVEAGVDDCDDIFQEFQDHWIDTGGFEHNAWHWWFDGSFPGSDVDVLGGGDYYDSLTWSDYFHQTWWDRRATWDGLPADDMDTMEALDTYFHNGWGVTLGFPTHAITAWGFRYDPDEDPDDFEDYYVGIWVTDPDDDKRPDPDTSVVNPAEDYPDNLRYFTVSYDSALGKWRLPGYATVAGWPIDSFFAFEPYQDPGVNTHRPNAHAGGPHISSEGSSIGFDGSASSDADGNALVYRWDVDNDGDWDSAWSASPFNYAYFDDYSGQVVMEVCDGHLRDVATTSVVVHNVNPTAEAGSDQTVDEGDTVWFSGTITDPGFFDTFTIEWDFNTDGTIDATGSLIPSHVYADEGTYQVTLYVTDDDGGWDSDYLYVTVNNVAPTVDAGADQTVDEGDTVSFTGSYTDPGSTDTHTIEWNFGDGIIIEGELSPTHSYCGSTTYTATLTVRDNDGAEGSDTCVITVLNVAPTADAGSDQTADEGDTVEFNGSATFDPGCDILTYTWDFDDGYTGTGIYPTHEYCDNGLYTVTLTVEDGEGGIGTDTMTVTVNNVAPSADAGPDQTVNESDTVNLLGVISDVGTCDTYIYVWSFGDGTPVVTDTLTPTHIYGDNGIFTVSLTVTDDDGATDFDEMFVTVNNIAPAITADISMEPPYAENPTYILPIVHELNFSATSHDPGSDDLQFTWTWDDGTTDAHMYYNDGTNPDGYPSPEVQPITQTDIINHTYLEPGIYNVTVMVTDDDGGVVTSIIYQVTILSVDAALDNINTTLQDLPANVFKGPAGKRKIAFANIFGALHDQYADEEYSAMIQFLNNSIRARCDGDVDGKKGDDWIKDTDTQILICAIIDDLIAYLTTLL